MKKKWDCFGVPVGSKEYDELLDHGYEPFSVLLQPIQPSTSRLNVAPSQPAFAIFAYFKKELEENAKPGFPEFMTMKAEPS